MQEKKDSEKAAAKAAKWCYIILIHSLFNN
jgi:hypothetical protein